MIENYVSSKFRKLFSKYIFLHVHISLKNQSVIEYKVFLTIKYIRNLLSPDVSNGYNIFVQVLQIQ